MRILLDECVVKRLAGHLSNQQVSTLSSMGWRGLKNGKLLTATSNTGFEILLTVDKQMRHQQNMSYYPIAIVIFNSHFTTLGDVLPLLPSFEARLGEFTPYSINVISQPL